MFSGWRRYAIIVLLVALLAIRIWRNYDRLPDKAPVPSFSGDSTSLRDTVIVPTLDTPVAAGKNVIWCSSFQIAWDRLKNDVVKAPVQVKGAETVAKRLNEAPQSEKDLMPESYYAAAGYINKGIADQVRSAMAQKFPAVAPPQFNAPPEAVVAYAYMAADVKFTIPFFENRKELVFKSSTGEGTAVSSFGVRAEDDYAYYQLRKQVGLLYSKYRENAPRGLEEFVVDPCRDSSPNQVLLACIKPEATLRETVAALEQRLASSTGDRHRETLGPNDVILVPNVLWEITHHFRELEGKDKLLSNPGFEGLYLDTALQAIHFRLDRCGAELASEAKVLYMPIPTYYVFDRPFLIYMKRRDAKEPFFVMWVANAELLSKR